MLRDVNGFHEVEYTYVSEALWYGKLKKKKKKTSQFPDLKLSQNVQNHSLFKMCKFYGKINGRFLLEIKMCFIMLKY